MKKILIFLMLALFLTSCYDEFRNDYPYTTVAFSTATGGLSTAGELGRTVVKGEGLKLDIGVYLAGVLENKVDRTVTFEIDESLLAGTSYELMPDNYYNLSNNGTFTIPAGSWVGKITVTLDSALFLADQNTVNYHYAIPIKLNDTSADSILSTQSTKIIVIKYITRAEGYFNQTGSFTTYDATNAEINNGDIENVVPATTISLDSVETNTIMHLKGGSYYLHVRIHPDNTVSWKKLPNLPPSLMNLAVESDPVLTTDYCSGWETLAAVNDGLVPPNSRSYDYPKFGNWNSANDWGWLQYDFPRAYRISSSSVYWWTDDGGLLFPTDQYIEYHDIATDTWVQVTNAVGYGNAGDVFNVTTFDEVMTDGVRLSFINSSESVGVSEWQVWGIGDPQTPEEKPIAAIVPNGANTWDPATSTFTLNYKITYEGETYYTNASTKLVWRNRIRDGVNEWRR